MSVPSYVFAAPEVVEPVLDEPEPLAPLPVEPVVPPDVVPAVVVPLPPEVRAAPMTTPSCGALNPTRSRIARATDAMPRPARTAGPVARGGRFALTGS